MHYNNNKNTVNNRCNFGISGDFIKSIPVSLYYKWKKDFVRTSQKKIYKKQLFSFIKDFNKAKELEHKMQQSYVIPLFSFPTIQQTLDI